MRLVSKLFSLACLIVAIPVVANADFTQIAPGTFVVAPLAPSNATAYQSVFDTFPGLLPGELPNFSVAYDNFSSVGIDGNLTSLTWIGKYVDPPTVLTPTTTSFRISIYADNGANAPLNDLYNEAPLYSQTVTATESPTGALPDSFGDDFFQYTASVPTFLMTADTKYWLSILGAQDYGVNGFGWAYSSFGGDNVAFGDFQPGFPANTPPPAISRFSIASDFAFTASITAVPEPSSCLLLAGAIGTIMFRKLRARRKLSA